MINKNIQIFKTKVQASMLKPLNFSVIIHILQNYYEVHFLVPCRNQSVFFTEVTNKKDFSSVLQISLPFPLQGNNLFYFLHTHCPQMEA